MKRTIPYIFVAMLLNMLASVSLYAAEKLTLDPEHTYVLWHIKHLGFSTQAGKWYASGFLTIDKDKPENSTLEVTIDLTKMVTGLPELDKHLKGKLFFDVEHYPTAKYVSNKVNVTGKNTATVEGTLTLHGVSKPVTLLVTLNQVGENPINNRMTAGFTATASIKRSDFGINTLLPQLGDEVALDINAEAYQPAPGGSS